MLWRSVQPTLPVAQVSTLLRTREEGFTTLWRPVQLTLPAAQVIALLRARERAFAMLWRPVQLTLPVAQVITLLRTREGVFAILWRPVQLTLPAAQVITQRGHPVQLTLPVAQVSNLIPLHSRKGVNEKAIAPTHPQGLRLPWAGERRRTAHVSVCRYMLNRVTTRASTTNISGMSSAV